MHPFKQSVMFFCAAATLILSGCASFNMTKPAPAQKQPIAIKYSSQTIDGMNDLPPDTYTVPGSQVIISGHQKGGNAGMFFGLLGVAVQSAINSSAGKDATKEAEQALHLSLVTDAEKITQSLIATEQFNQKFTTTVTPESPTLLVSSAIAMTFVNDTDARPYVILKAKLMSTKAATSSSAWTTRYIASAGPAKPLVGANSWTADGGTALKNMLSINLERAVKFMLTDIANPHPRNDQTLTMVQGDFPFVKTRLQTVGYQLDEDEQSIYFVPKVGDVIVFSGINIMDKSVISHRAATKTDPALKVIEAPTK